MLDKGVFGHHLHVGIKGDPGASHVPVKGLEEVLGRDLDTESQK